MNKVQIAKLIGLVVCVVTTLIYFLSVVKYFRTCDALIVPVISLGVIQIGLILFLILVSYFIKNKLEADTVVKLNGLSSSSDSDLFLYDDPKETVDRGLCVFKSICYVMIALVTVLMILVISLVIYGHLSTLPQLTGTMKYNGLLDAVHVERDPDGIVHIKAQNLHDLYFSQAIAQAQDRLWQMEFQKRLVMGRLSEVLGEDALDIDKFMLTLGIYEKSEMAVSNFPDDAIDLLDSYLNGLNEYLHSSPPLPIEFKILGFTPSNWTRAHIVGWAKIMSWDLSQNIEQTLHRLSLLSKNIPLERISVLNPPKRNPTVLNNEEMEPRLLNSSYSYPPLEEDLQLCEPIIYDSSQKRNLDINLIAVKESWERIKTWVPKSPRASNNWVISGSLTKSGKPILANDPHLVLTAPSIWMMFHLETPDMKMIGASLAGVPSIIIGRNDFISWGVTNVGADNQDLYIMTESSDGLQYLYNGEYTSYNVKTIDIPVKGQDPFVLTVKESVFGPVISDVMDTSENTISFQWTTLQETDDTTLAFLKLSNATNWEQFRDALSHYSAPSQNFIYADVTGNIGYQVPGKIPIRKSTIPGKPNTGGMPVPGDGTNFWDGYIPFDDLPSTYNPEKGFIVTANNKVHPETYKYNILYDADWEFSYRAQRITDLILTSTEHTVDTVIDIQMDVHSYIFEDFKFVLEHLASKNDELEEESKVWVKKLLNFSGVADVESKETTVFNFFLRELQKISSNQTGSEWSDFDYLKNALDLTNQKCSKWSIESMKRGLAAIKDKYHTIPEWGDAHKLEIEHQVLTGTPIGCLFNRQAKRGGDYGTVNVGHSSMDTWYMKAGPSYRQIIDWTDVDNNSVWVQPMGQSGNILSPFYDNLLPKWLTGEYLKMTTTDYSAMYTLTLTPQ